MPNEDHVWVACKLRGENDFNQEMKSRSLWQVLATLQQSMAESGGVSMSVTFSADLDAGVLVKCADSKDRSVIYFISMLIPQPRLVDLDQPETAPKRKAVRVIMPEVRV